MPKVLIHLPWIQFGLILKHITDVKFICLKNIDNFCGGYPFIMSDFMGQDRIAEWTDIVWGYWSAFQNIYQLLTAWMKTLISKPLEYKFNAN